MGAVKGEEEGEGPRAGKKKKKRGEWIKDERPA